MDTEEESSGSNSNPSSSQVEAPQIVMDKFVIPPEPAAGRSYYSAADWKKFSVDFSMIEGMVPFVPRMPELEAMTSSEEPKPNKPMRLFTLALCSRPTGPANFGVYTPQDLTVKIHNIDKRARELHRRLGILKAMQDTYAGKKLRLAASTNNVDEVTRLLQSGVKPNLTDSKKRTALHIAASKGYEDVVRVLLEQGADGNLKDVIGNTPLHLAACINHVGVVTLLLKAGTDIKALDNLGRTPLQLAQSKLRLICKESFSNPEATANEVHQIIDMMTTYLQKAGQTEEAELMQCFSNKLQLSQNKQELDTNILDLLGSLEHMSIR